MAASSGSALNTRFLWGSEYDRWRQPAFDSYHRGTLFLLVAVPDIIGGDCGVEGDASMVYLCDW